MFDKNTNGHVYFYYKATMRDFHKEMLKYQMQRQTKQEALESLRKGIVYAMRAGDSFVINLDRLAANFKQFWEDDEVFPT